MPRSEQKSLEAGHEIDRAGRNWKEERRALEAEMLEKATPPSGKLSDGEKAAVLNAAHEAIEIRKDPFGREPIPVVAPNAQLGDMLNKRLMGEQRVSQRDITQIQADRAGAMVARMDGVPEKAKEVSAKIMDQFDNVQNPKAHPFLDKNTGFLGDASGVTAKDIQALSGEAYLKRIGASPSLIEGFTKGDGTAHALVYLLREAKDWFPLRDTLFKQIRYEHRTLGEFQRLGATDKALFTGLSKATETLEKGQTLAVLGSFSTDLVTFSNRHMMMKAAQRGELNLAAMSELYGKGGEAMVYGRIIPDMTKKGGPFSDSGDFDFAIFGAKGSYTAGHEAIQIIGKDAQKVRADEIRPYLPNEKMKALPADFDYAKYENKSLRGFETTYRGRIMFSEGGFTGRQMSLTYGAGGAVTRDFAHVFNFVPQARQAEIGHWVNVEMTSAILGPRWKAGVGKIAGDINVGGGAAIMGALNSASWWADKNSRAQTVTATLYGGIRYATTTGTLEGVGDNDRTAFQGLYFAFGNPSRISGTIPRPYFWNPGSGSTGAAPFNGYSEGGGGSGTSPGGSPLVVDAADFRLPVSGYLSPQAASDPASPLSVYLQTSLDAAKQWWADALGYMPALDVILDVEDIQDGQLGAAQLISTTPDGRPRLGRIVIDATADGRGWFIDTTPGGNSEFAIRAGESAWRALPGSAGSGRFDLVTMLAHEYGHLLGFTSEFSGFASRVQRMTDGRLVFADGDGFVALSDGDHVDPAVFQHDLMSSTLPTGMRRMPSLVDSRILAAAWESARLAWRETGAAPVFQSVATKLGFAVLSDQVGADLPAPNPSLLNGGFGTAEFGFGWHGSGNAAVADGVATLRGGGAGMLNDVLQTFVIPARALSLQFTLNSWSLTQNGGRPADAFEVALLDPVTGASLSGAARTRGDAFLNIQAGGTWSASSRVMLSNALGPITSGALPAGPITVTVDLMGVAAGEVATLFFDLASFGPGASAVEIDDVRINVQPDTILPRASADSFTVQRGTTLDVPAGGSVLRNDSDPLGRPITAALVQTVRNGTLSLNPDGSFRYVPTAGFTGQDTFFYRAAVGGVMSDLALVTITVTAQVVEQRPPQFTAGPNQTVNENSAARVVAGWATAITAGLPAPTGSTALTFLVSTDRPELFSVAPTVAANGTLSFTPAPFANGNATVTVRLQDNGGVAGGRQDTSSPQVFTITILPVNQPPNYTAGPDQSVASNAGPVVRTGWATAISAGPGNESAQTVSFVLTADRPELFAAAPTLAADGTLRFTPKAGAFGRATINIVARDNGGTANGGSDTAAVRTFTIDVVYVNQPPTYVPGGDVTVNQDSGPRVVSGWASNISIAQTGAPVTRLDFIVTNDQPGLFDSAPELGRDGTLRFTPKAGAFGTAIVQIVARNDGGTANGGVDSTAPRTFAIRIAALPVIGDVTLGQGGFIWQQLDTSVITSLFVTSPDGGAVSLSILEGPRWLTLDALTGRLGGSPRVGDPGLSTVVIAATSTTGGVTTRSFQVGIFRQTEAPSAWVPWSGQSAADRGFLPLTGAPAIGSGNASQQPVRIAASLVKRVAGKIRIELADPGDVALVEVTLAGADGILGTADDIRLTGEAVSFTVNGSTLSVDVGQTNGPVRIQFVIRGVVYVAEVD